MGQKMTISKYRPPKGEEICRNQFEFQYIIGRGGFGKVWKVIDKKHKISYALKEMQKVKVIDKKSENSIKYERELLSRLKHPFIVNMYYSFQDAENLYLVMDLLNGGDLRYHISRHRQFSEEQTKFFIACILLGLEYIHSKNILHRDIKPENLVLDEKGYVRVTDFGIAKIFSKKNSSETSGTPGYMAPEVMNRQNHTAVVDYFALGVIGNEFMLGRRPYIGKSRKEIKEQMMAKQAYIHLRDIPDGWSEEAADFFNRLLNRKPESRLGYKGAIEVKEHPWIKYYPWKMLLEKKIESPFIPEKRDNFDKRYCESIDKIGVETKLRYEGYKNEENFANLFQNFTYYGIIDDDLYDNTTTNINKSNTSKINEVIINKNDSNNNTNNSIITSLANSNNTSIIKNSSQLKRTSSSLLLQNNSNNTKEIPNSISYNNIFQYYQNYYNKSFIKNQYDKSYATKALINKSNKHIINFSSKRIKANNNQISKTPPRNFNKRMISNNSTSISRASTPINRVTNLSISPSNLSLLNSYAEKNKKVKLFESGSNSRPFIKSDNESITSSLLRKIMMNKRNASINLNLKRAQSNFNSKEEIETSVNKSNKNMSNYKRSPNISHNYMNINRNYGFMKKNSEKRNIVNNCNSKEIKIDDQNNVNVSVVVINNGIINVNNNSNVNRNFSKRKQKKPQKKTMHTMLKSSNSMNSLFNSIKIGMTRKDFS